MFDFAWSEIALIGIVALVAIGPKDLPVAMKAVSGMIKKARRMAGEFQTHVDEMVRDADLGEVRDQFNQIRKMDIKNTILKAVDEDGSIRSGLSKPTMDFSPPPPPVPVHDAAPAETAVVDYPGVQMAPDAPALDSVPGLTGSAAEPAGPVAPAPAFIPPNYAPAQAAIAPAPPAFVPPAFVPEHA